MNFSHHHPHHHYSGLFALYSARVSRQDRQFINLLLSTLCKQCAKLSISRFIYWNWLSVLMSSHMSRPFTSATACPLILLSSPGDNAGNYYAHLLDKQLGIDSVTCRLRLIFKCHAFFVRSKVCIWRHFLTGNGFAFSRAIRCLSCLRRHFDLRSLRVYSVNRR